MERGDMLSISAASRMLTASFCPLAAVGVMVFLDSTGLSLERNLRHWQALSTSCERNSFRKRKSRFLVSYALDDFECRQGSVDETSDRFSSSPGSKLGQRR
jgi:hypothetical protein